MHDDPISTGPRQGCRPAGARKFTKITPTKGYTNMANDLIKSTDASPAALADLAQKINQAHEGAIRSARTAIEYAIECGRLLTEAKALVGHGNWLPWLQANTIVSERTASRWMRFAENSEVLLAKSATDGDFTFAEADRLLAASKAEPCEPARPEAATRYDAACEAVGALHAYWETVPETVPALVAAAPEVARLFDRASEAIRAARDHDDGEDVADPVEQLKFYKRVRKDPTLELQIAQSKLRSIRAIGLLHKEWETSTVGGERPASDQGAFLKERADAIRALAKQVSGQVDQMRQLATTPEEQEMVAEFERDENVRSCIDLAAPKFHPITEIIPMTWMPVDELHALADSIRAVGQLHPIVVDEKTDMIVDGRLRWRACEIAGVEPKIERREFADDEDILNFIISMNVHRSQWTEDQRVVAAARLANLLSVPHEPEPSEPARPEAEPRPATDWVSRLSAEYDAIVAKADERLPGLRVEMDAAKKIKCSEDRMRVLLALRNESLEWANRLTEARVRHDREFALAAPDEPDTLGERHAARLRLYALADDETFAAAIETVKERDEELTDKRLQREIEWRLKQPRPKASSS